MCSHSSGLVKFVYAFVLLPFFDPLLGLFDAGFIGRRTVSFPLVDPFLRSFLFLGGTADLVLVFFPVVDPFLGIRVAWNGCGRRFFVDKLLLHRRRFRCIVAAPFRLSKLSFRKFYFPTRSFQVSIRTFLYFEGFLRVFRPGAFAATRTKPTRDNNRRG